MDRPKDHTKLVTQLYRWKLDLENKIEEKRRQKVEVDELHDARTGQKFFTPVINQPKLDQKSEK